MLIKKKSFDFPSCLALLSLISRRNILLALIPLLATLLAA